MWINKSTEFYSRSMKSRLQDNNKEMYWTHNEKEYVVPKRFIRTLKTKVYKYMTSIPTNAYIGKLNHTRQ